MSTGKQMATTRSNSRSADFPVDEIVAKVVGSEKFITQLACLMKENVKEVLEEFTQRYEAKIKSLEDQLDDSNCRLDALEQQSKLKNLRVYGIAEVQGEIMPDKLISVLCNKMDIDIPRHTIASCYRLSAKENGIRPILVTFNSMETRNVIFNSKKKLKSSKIVVREDLTKLRLELLKDAKMKFRPIDVWSNSGRIIIRGENNRLQKIYRRSQLDALKA